MDPLNLDPEISILLWGDTQHGKSALVGELAEHIDLTEGKKTVLFQADRGGMQPLRPHIRAGIIKEVIRPDGNFHIWLARAAQGEKWNGKAWESVLTEDVGLVVHEGISAYCDLMFMAMSEATAAGKGHGGEDNFVLTAEDRGTKIKFSNTNRAGYMLAQREVLDLLYRRQFKVPTLWTALARRDDEDNRQRESVIGPLVAGRALTSTFARLFDYTFRVQAVPGQQGPVRSLHLDIHKDQQATGAFGVAGMRNPLLGKSVVVPPVIVPASLVKALELIQARQRAADLELQEKRAKRG